MVKSSQWKLALEGHSQRQLKPLSFVENKRLWWMTSLSGSWSSPVFNVWPVQILAKDKRNRQVLALLEQSFTKRPSIMRYLWCLVIPNCNQSEIVWLTSGCQPCYLSLKSGKSTLHETTTVRFMRTSMFGLCFQILFLIMCMKLSWFYNETLRSKCFNIHFLFCYTQICGCLFCMVYLLWILVFSNLLQQQEN